MARSFNHSAVALVTALVVFILFWLSYPEHQDIGSDAAAYAKGAHAILRGSFRPTAHPFDQRLAVLLPTAFFYELFGVTLLSTNLWPHIASCIIIACVWMSLSGRRERTAAVFLASTNPILWNQSRVLYPDLICTAFLAAFSIFILHRENITRKRIVLRSLAAIGAALCLVLGFLAKETAVWLIPLWGWCCLTDLKRQRLTVIVRFHLPVLALLAAFSVLYLASCRACYGDMWARFSPGRSARMEFRKAFG